MLVGKQTGKWPDDCDCHEKHSSSRILGVQMPLIRGPAASIKRWMRASDEVRDGWGEAGHGADRPEQKASPLTSRGERTTGTVRDGVVAHAHERNGRSDDGVSSPRFMVGRSPRRSQRGSSKTAVAALLVAGRAGAGSLQWGGSRGGAAAAAAVDAGSFQVVHGGCGSRLWPPACSQACSGWCQWREAWRGTPLDGRNLGTAQSPARRRRPGALQRVGGGGMEPQACPDGTSQQRRLEKSLIIPVESTKLQLPGADLEATKEPTMASYPSQRDVHRAAPSEEEQQHHLSSAPSISSGRPAGPACIVRTPLPSAIGIDHERWRARRAERADRLLSSG
ncbi:hypothetical protein PCL_02734 [Purpureocillium lilacinum]|uniref:Uncharacterized protein n=1 Tax=Purpureocillium lilacinum TaxID=33203 RepID=A0A2U3DZZ4_PURLI|nr:hypothetical protein PCL_02734 [Purpureocillium lilacinum]